MEKELYKKYRNDSEGLEKYLVDSLGYKYLGWQVHTGNNEAIKNCHSNGHYGKLVSDGFLGGDVVGRKVFDIQHNQRGSDVTYWCEECEHYWKIDMSD